MTVLMRQDMNDADLAWAAADASMSSAMEQLLQARETLASDQQDAQRSPREGRVVDPALLRAWGAL